MKISSSIGLTLFVLMVASCAKDPANRGDQARLSAASIATINNQIDISLPGSPEPTANSEIFDESVSFYPNFAINQKVPELSDLFGKNGSNLCFPTALAEALSYLYAYHSPAENQLLLPGLSQDKKTLDGNNLVRSLATDCKTDIQSGTKAVDAIACTIDVALKSGYGTSQIQLISPFAAAGDSIISREVSLQDIRTSLKSGFPVILLVSWYRFDQKTQRWIPEFGHYVTAFGYDYNASWGENEIQLKIINPLTDYGPSRKYSLWTTVTVERISPKTGLQYPAHQPFIVTGDGFGGLDEKAFLTDLLTVAPN